MDPIKKAFLAGFSSGYSKGQSDAGEGGSWLMPPSSDGAWKEYNGKLKKRANRTTYFAIYSPLIKEVIGVCTDDGKDNVMSEEPNCELRRITKKDTFGEGV